MSVKLTPLNIVLACLVAWVISEWGGEGEPDISWLWLFLLSLLLIITDLLLRVRYVDFKRLWAVQLVFVLTVAIILVILKLKVFI
ncbi:MAG TPA: hypothetical protein H9853_05995 [Candidatus Sphingobacterium stercoripullorum]|uniref:Uncharacterized protein n=1 Tax=Candidatus Sphingobacterium stercoripullorum TaxID=2838759 RepID=A0A9D1W8Y9_9SPHI|nr:hypothetical protein [Candidatus Sphingobacterium stercoripullorum]